MFLDLWLDWIKDEIGIATTEEEKEHVTMLCEKAVKDYLSNFIRFINCFWLFFYNIFVIV